MDGGRKKEKKREERGMGGAFERGIRRVSIQINRGDRSRNVDFNLFM